MNRSPRTPSVATIIAAATTTVTAAGIGLSLSATLIAVRLDEAHYSARAIGLHAAVSGLMGLLIAPYVPWLARLIGVRRLLILALMLAAACLVGFAETGGYWNWLAVRSFYSIALTIMFILGEFWISTVAWPDRRGLVLGIYATAISAGFAIGPFVLAAMGSASSAPFLVAALLSVAAVLPIGLVGADAPVLQKIELLPFSAILRQVPAASAAALLFGMIESSAFSLFPVFALRKGWGADAAAVATAVFSLGNALFQIPAGLATDRFGRMRMLILIGALGTAGALAMPMAARAGYSFYVVFLFIWSGIVGSLYVAGLSILSSRFTNVALARANAAYIMLYTAGTLIGPAMFGLSLSLTPDGLFIAMAAGIFFFFVLTLGRGTHP